MSPDRSDTFALCPMRLDRLGLDLRPGPSAQHDLRQRLPGARTDALERGPYVEDHGRVEGLSRVGDVNRTAPVGERSVRDGSRKGDVGSQSGPHDLRRVFRTAGDPLAERI